MLTLVELAGAGRAGKVAVGSLLVVPLVDGLLMTLGLEGRGGGVGVGVWVGLGARCTAQSPEVRSHVQSAQRLW